MCDDNINYNWQQKQINIQTSQPFKNIYFIICGKNYYLFNFPYIILIITVN